MNHMVDVLLNYKMDESNELHAYLSGNARLQPRAKRGELKGDVRSGSKYKMKSSNMLQKGPIVNMAITESMLFYLFAKNYKS
jgi:hypothetical protein